MHRAVPVAVYVLTLLSGPALEGQTAPAPQAGQGAQRAPLPEGYWPRGQRPEPGRAPGMRVTDMGAAGRTYRLNFTRGDELLSGMTEFAQQHQIKSAHFVGLGAIDKGILGWTDTERGNGQKMIPVNEQAEIISFQGSISANAQGVPTVHAHGAISRQDGSVVGGHVFEMHVSIIAEIWVTEENPGN